MHIDLAIKFVKGFSSRVQVTHSKGNKTESEIKIFAGLVVLRVFFFVHKVGKGNVSA